MGKLWIRTGSDIRVGSHIGMLAVKHPRVRAKVIRGRRAMAGEGPT